MRRRGKRGRRNREGWGRWGRRKASRREQTRVPFSSETA